VLLPLAVLAQTEAPEALLEQIADRIDSIEDISQQRNLAAYAQLLAGLRFEKDLIRQIFRDSFMRESAIYQEIFQEGRQEGRQEGEQIIVLRLLSRRFGTLPTDLQTRIRALSLPRLEALSEALLEFNTVSDLIDWLETS
jgi:predicted transposase YdaD